MTCPRCESVRPWIGSGRQDGGTRPRCSAIAAVTRRLPPSSANRSHRGASRRDSTAASWARPAWAARVIDNAGVGRVPPITEYQASQPAFRPVAGHADRDVLGNRGPNRRDVLTRCSRVGGDAGDLDRCDAGQLGDTGVQFRGECEVRGARVVVDDDREVGVLDDSAEQSEHIVVGEGLVSHRGQQYAGRTRLLRAVDMGQDVRGAQITDSDEHRG